MRLVRERGVSIAQAARDLGIHANLLRNWVKAFADDPQHSFPGHGQMKPEQAEIARLKREVNKLKAERGIDVKFAFIAKHRDLAGGMVVRGTRCSRGVGFMPG